jgi:alginate O-acetyltransferase complex protein AlgI
VSESTALHTGDLIAGGLRCIIAPSFRQTNEEKTLPLYSVTFAVFFVLVLSVYWFLNRWGIRWQNLFLLVSSCVFYGWFDYRFVALLLLGGVIDYLVSQALMSAVQPGMRRTLLGISLAANLGALAFFKYYDFFVPLFASMLQAAGLQIDPGTLTLVVPIGISFFTLQRLSYTIEIYRKRFAATRDPFAFLAFSCFFPLLMSGPIERATQLLPQFLKVRSFDRAKSKDALRLILWGLFKKVVIADSLAGRVAFVFTNYDRLAGIDLGGGAFLFAIQLYADFSGYSDIALGISRLFGFRVTRNFAYPYFSRDMAEFWRRWHLSLSSWFRDYIFTPLTWNVNLKAYWRRMGIVLLTFTASGLWHGAAWKFIVWGALNGLGFAPLVFGDVSTRQTRQVAEGRIFPTVREGIQMVVLFTYVWVAWIFFRAASLEHALRFLAHMLTHTWIALPGANWLLLMAAAFLLIEWVMRAKEHPLFMPELPAILRWAIYCALSITIYYSGHLGQLDFIYTHF